MELDAAGNLLMSHGVRVHNMVAGGLAMSAAQRIKTEVLDVNGSGVSTVRLMFCGGTVITREGNMK